MLYWLTIKLVVAAFEKPMRYLNTWKCMVRFQSTSFDRGALPWPEAHIWVTAKVEKVYSPVSSSSAALLPLHNYRLVTGPCSFEPSQLPEEYTAWQVQVLAHSTDHTPKPSRLYQVPTCSLVERVHVWMKCLPKSTTPCAAQPSPAQPSPAQPSPAQPSQWLEPAITLLPLRHCVPQDNRTLHMYTVFAWWLSESVALLYRALGGPFFTLERVNHMLYH